MASKKGKLVLMDFTVRPTWLIPMVRREVGAVAVVDMVLKVDSLIFLRRLNLKSNLVLCSRRRNVDLLVCKWFVKLNFDCIFVVAPFFFFWVFVNVFLANGKAEEGNV